MIHKHCIMIHTTATCCPYAASVRIGLGTTVPLSPGFEDANWQYTQAWMQHSSSHRPAPASRPPAPASAAAAAAPPASSLVAAPAAAVVVPGAGGGLAQGAAGWSLEARLWPELQVWGVWEVWMVWTGCAQGCGAWHDRCMTDIGYPRSPALCCPPCNPLGKQVAAFPSHHTTGQKHASHQTLPA